jgi:hypothetical protein
MDFIARLLVLVVLVAFALWAFTQGRMASSRPAIASRFIGSYEIPNPYPSVLLLHAGIAVIPGAALVMGHRWIAAAVAVAVGVALFHVRNMAVRIENAAGRHGPVPGKSGE